MKAKYLLCPAAFLLLASCNENEVFTKEQYKHVFSFVSNADHVSEKVFNLSDTARVGYVALSMGGSTGTEKDVTVNIVKAPELLEAYNVTQYDNAVDKYARLLPESHYTLSSMQFVVKAGQTTGVIPLTVRPEGLSPDSTYYLPLRIQSYDAYEANATRNYVFYNVRIKNTWAAAGGSSYSMSELRYVNGSTTALAVPGTKTLFAIGANTVRTMAGNETFDKSRANLDSLRYSSISMLTERYKFVLIATLRWYNYRAMPTTLTSILLKKQAMVASMVTSFFITNISRVPTGTKSRKNFV